MSKTLTLPKYRAGQRVRATSATSTGIITSASRSLITWKWDHDTVNEWSATPGEFADIAEVVERPATAVLEHLRKILGITPAHEID